MTRFTTISIGMAATLMLCVICPFSTKAQINQEACRTVLHDRIYEQMQQEVEIIQRFQIGLRGRSEAASVDSVPVYFTVFRNDGGTLVNSMVDENLIRQALIQLNELFGPMDLYFYQLGDINYIDNTAFTDFRTHHHLRSFSYVSTALNVYTKSGSGSFAQFPAPVAPMDDSMLPDLSKDRSNMLSLNNAHFLTTSFAHEIGHSYGLLHTFEGAKVYNNPTAPTPGFTGSFQDHPYGENGNSRRRELVIRQSNPGKDFPFPNSTQAGDFVEDTPAFCVSTTSFPSFYPKRSTDACERYPFDKQSCNGCIVVDCNYEGDYVDYNGDTLVNTQVSIKNIMSYTNCRSEFTAGQYDRMRFYHEKVRKLQYDTDANINLTGKVLFEDSDIPMDDVVLHFSHAEQYKFSNTTTTTTGAFQAILYDPTASVKILKAGTALDANYQPSPWVQATMEEIFVNSYQEADWLEGIDDVDVALLKAHLAGTETLDGYHQLAADLDGDGQLTDQDLQLLELLAKRQISPQIAFEMPWRFLPAYIPKQYPTSFQHSPFNMEIDGVSYQDFAPYLEVDWEFTISNAGTSERNFRAIKLGDLNGSSLRPQEVVAEITPPHTAGSTSTPGMPTQSSKKLICYPNPTLGAIAVAFKANFSGNASLVVTDPFFRTLYQTEVQLAVGANKFSIEEQQLPAGIVLVMLQTSEGIFYRKVTKLNDG